MTTSDPLGHSGPSPTIRKLAAILSADVKGYSRLMGIDEVATIRLLAVYRGRMAELIDQHRGRVIDMVGDNLLADFGSAVDALQSAIAIQQDLQRRNAELAAAERMEFRIGINVGDVVVEGDRIYGDGVNIAARVESLADAGGICISGAVHEQVANKMPFGFVDLGEQTVKNIARSVRVYRVLLDNPPRSTYESTLDDSLPLPDKPSIVVLPFLNLSGDAEQEYFSDGITEDLITDLSKISGLFVISRNSSFTYKGVAVRPEQVGKALGVRYLLEGSVRKAGNRVRITAQLIDATSDFHLWSERYDRDLQDIFAVQDEVTQKIVGALQVKLTQREQASIGAAPTGNLEAYDFYLRGLEFHARRTEESNALARQMFERALELDPQFAAACAMLGRTYLMAIAFQWGDYEFNRVQLRLLAERAVALNNGLAVAHETLAYSYLGRKQHANAIAAAERAVELEPNSADALESLGEILSFSGRGAEALTLIDQAMRLNPRYPPSYLWAQGQTYWLIGRVDDAVAAFRRVITRNPDHVTAHLMLASIFGETGRIAEASVEVREMKRINPHLSLTNVHTRAPHKEAANLERFKVGLQKAGFS